MRRQVLRKTCAEPGCNQALCRSNKSGLCRSHCSKAMFRDPTFVRKIRAGCRRKHADPQFKARLSENLSQLHKDPEFAAAHSARLSERHKSGWHPTPRGPGKGPTADEKRFQKMTSQEWDDYQLLRGKDFTVAEALTSIGRKDLAKL